MIWRGWVEVAPLVQAALQSRTGLSRAAFVRQVGVRKAMLPNRGGRGPAQVLLALIAREPGIVQGVLG